MLWSNFKNSFKKLIESPQLAVRNLVYCMV